MQIFLDSTDTKVIADLASTGLIDGVTTNPTLIAKSGRPMLEVIAEICDIVPGPISAEVAATTADAMIAEGQKLAKIAPNVVVKIPLTRDGLIACAAFAVAPLDDPHRLGASRQGVADDLLPAGLQGGGTFAEAVFQVLEQRGEVLAGRRRRTALGPGPLAAQDRDGFFRRGQGATHDGKLAWGRRFAVGEGA